MSLARLQIMRNHSLLLEDWVQLGSVRALTTERKIIFLLHARLASQ